MHLCQQWGKWGLDSWHHNQIPIDKWSCDHSLSLMFAADGGQHDWCDKQSIEVGPMSQRMSTSKHSQKNAGSVQWNMPVENYSEGLGSKFSGRTTRECDRRSHQNDGCCNTGWSSPVLALASSLAFRAVQMVVRKKLKYQKVFSVGTKVADWPPEERMNGVESELLVVLRVEGEYFLSRKVAYDESWCPNFELCSKVASIQCERPRQPKNKTFKSQYSAGKFLLTELSDQKGLLLLDF